MHESKDYDRKYGDFFEKYSPQTNAERAPYVRKRQVSVDYENRRRNERAANKRKSRTPLGIKVLCLAIVASIIVACGSALFSKTPAISAESLQGSTTAITSTKAFVPQPKLSLAVKNPAAEINSKYAVLIDVDSGEILAGKGYNERIAPASMTKVMTLLVAAENVTNINDRFIMTYELLNPLYNSDCSLVGFQEGEQVKIYDLFYATALRSAADATVALAMAIADSEDKFVELMNKKAKKLGLKKTHFSNVIGLDDEQLYTTPYEMALIFEAALDNEFCRTVMSTENYTIEKSDYHPDGIVLKNSMFEKMYGTEPIVATIKGGKTGFTSNAGYCLVSYAQTIEEHELILVTAKAEGNYQPVYDAFTMYRNYSGIEIPTTTIDKVNGFD